MDKFLEIIREELLERLGREPTEDEIDEEVTKQLGASLND